MIDLMKTRPIISYRISSSFTKIALTCDYVLFDIQICRFENLFHALFTSDKQLVKITFS